MTKNDEPLASEDPSFPPIEIRYNVLRACLDTDLFAWAKRVGGVDPLDKEEAVKIILRHEYRTEVYTSFFARLARREENREAGAKLAREQFEKQDIQVHYPPHPKMGKAETIDSSDPRFPSIDIRADVLNHVYSADLIAWASHLGAKPAGKEEAILAILRHDYDEKTFETWLELASKKEQEFYARRQASKNETSPLPCV